MKSVLLPPQHPSNIPLSAQWLAGEGAGSWFYLENTNQKDNFRIKRFSPEGNLECDKIFTLTSSSLFDIKQPFTFTYISHCQKCTILQNGYNFIFKAI